MFQPRLSLMSSLRQIMGFMLQRAACQINEKPNNFTNQTKNE